MRRDRNPRLSLIEKLLSEPRRLIATILIGNEFVNVSASVLSATIIMDLFGAGNSWLNILIMVPLLLLFGEITPKTLAFANNIAFATFQSRYIELFARFITPLRIVVRSVSEFFIKRIVSGEPSQSNILTEDMVRSLTNAAVGEGSLDTKESEYIHQIFDFGNRSVSDLMTYRSQLVSARASMSFAEIVDVIRLSRHSKVPVFSADGQSVDGVLYARDFLDLDISAEPPHAGHQINERLRKPYFVPATRKASDLFVAMRERCISLALVTDEFGGVVGLITLEDLLQCIFGDLPSWSDSRLAESSSLDALGDGHYRASGSLTIRQFNTIAGTHLERVGVSTIAGLVLHTRGEFPAKGDVVVVDNVTFTVSDLTQQRIVSVDVQVGSEADAETPTSDGSGG
jgi:putative hemolysin